jgi:hypothetical protein
MDKMEYINIVKHMRGTCGHRREGLTIFSGMQILQTTTVGLNWGKKSSLEVWKQ